MFNTISYINLIPYLKLIQKQVFLICRLRDLDSIAQTSSIASTSLASRNFKRVQIISLKYHLINMIKYVVFQISNLKMSLI